MYLFRKSQYHQWNKLNLIPYFYYKLALKKYTFKFGYDIPSHTKIGKGFYINHLNGITINPQVVIGNNVNMTKGVTIGQTNRGSKKGVPVIGDRVWIGANATIVGKINIGNNVLVAPNSYINFDVPDNSVVIGNPAKIIDNKNATTGYINNLV